MSAAPVATGKRDRSDLLNPILVKELRQGIRGTLFTGSSLLLHLLMLSSVVVSLVTVGQGVNRSFSDGLFWFLITIPVLVILPLSGGASLAGEKTAHTLEPVLLTRLTSRQIVVGKWASVALQSALLISSVLPYVVLRYFLGGVDVLSEVLGLVDLWICCLLLTAVAVGLASLRASALFRWALVFFLGGYILVQLQSFLAFWSPLGGTGRWQAFFLALALAMTALILVLFLEVGALQVAPPAEARSDRVRMLALIALLVGLAISRAGAGRPMATGFETVLLGWTLIVMAGVAIGVICEDLKDVPGLYAPFFGRTGLRRHFRTLLAPGWPSGVCLTGLLLVGVGFILWPRLPAGERVGFLVALVGTVFTPLAILRVVPRSRLRTFPAYLLLQALSGVPAVLYGLGQLSDDDWLTAVGALTTSLMPFSALVLMGDLPRWSVYVLGAVTAVSVAVVGAQAVRGFRQIRERVRRVSEPGTGTSPAASLA